VASTFQVGRAFLAGDAAHIHSPAGAQGMNTGMHEAINLCHKLKLVLKDQGNPSLLKSYERETRPIALNVQRVTDFAFGIVIASESSGVRLLRRAVLPRVLGNHLVQRQMMKAMSEIRQSRKQITAMRKG
jgi:2-polyprenyl-6-methoxyphenol hydroxylase-like FAD-dependent oxidoreductase